ncbi:extracellular solute-binding protein [Actinopolymorpha pittospori]|nr:extracellular solute-binding protein [Actinopolymorpha pittospori]
MRFARFAAAALCGLSLIAAVGCSGSSPYSQSSSTKNDGSPKLQGSEFTYWYGLIFSDAANEALAAQIREWGKMRGVPVKPVPVNQNDLVTQVSAAMQAKTMPDALDMSSGLMIQLNSEHNLVDLTSLYDQLGKQYGGWLPAVGTAKTYPAYGFGVPYGVSGNILFRRHDVLGKAGYPDDPKTWEDVVGASIKAQDPPKTNGMGFALSNVGDAESFVEAVLHDYGARIANDSGTACTLDTPQTREAVTLLKRAWDAGLFPKDSTTWDGAGDNEAYQSGQTLFMANPGSVQVYMADNDPELNEGTRYSPLPAGPRMQVSPASLWSRVIPSSSKNKALAEDLIKYLSRPDNMEEYYKHAIYGPVLGDYAKFSLFNEASSPVLAGLKQLSQVGTTASYPDVNNVAYSNYSSTFQAAKMVQRVVVNNQSVDASVRRAQADCQQIYQRAGK